MNNCPSCGKPPKVLTGPTTGNSIIACCVSTPPYKNAKDAQKKWREMTRAAEPSPREQLNAERDEFGGFDKPIAVADAPDEVVTAMRRAADASRALIGSARGGVKT